MDDDDHVYLPRDPHDTQYEAAEIAYPHTTTQRRKVYDHINGKGPHGATDTELQQALDLAPNSERPRRRELVQQGRIIDSGQRRPALDTGNASIVWIALDQQQQTTTGAAMVDSIDLGALGVDTKRRDQYKRLLVVPPIGGKPTGYTRVTTVAKTLDDGGGLMPWKATMCATGMIMRRGLRSQWEALIAQYDDPWYAGDSIKAICKRLVEECAAVGGANDRAEMGTALHAITALYDLGRIPSHLTEETEADLEAYAEGLSNAGIKLAPGFVETTIVIDAYQVAGTFDRLASVPGFDLPLIADLKTGSSLDYSWQTFAVQLAGYSRGNAIYEQGANKDGSKDKRLPMPEVDQSTGLIMWLNAGAANLELHLVDLEAGWKGFEQSMWVRGWRKTPVAQPLTNAQLPLQAVNQPDSLVPVLEASIKAIEEAKASTPTMPPAQDDQEVIVDYQSSQAYNDQVRSWLQGRIQLIGANEAARKLLIARWPSDLPTLISSKDHTPDQLVIIERLLVDVEAKAKMPFGEPRPEPTEQMARLLQMFPNSTTTTNNQQGA
jgi:hypothetical protein